MSRACIDAREKSRWHKNGLYLQRLLAIWRFHFAVSFTSRLAVAGCEIVCGLPFSIIFMVRHC